MRMAKSNLALMASMAAMLGGAEMPGIGTGNTRKSDRGRVVHSGGTFNAGRNAEKRAAVTPYLRMKMLSDRRLRQRGLAR